MIKLEEALLIDLGLQIQSTYRKLQKAESPGAKYLLTLKLKSLVKREFELRKQSRNPEDRDKYFNYLEQYYAET